MTRFALLPILGLALACADTQPFQPADAVAPDDLLTAQADRSVIDALTADGKWEFHTRVTFVRTVQPEELRSSASGVLHGKGLINEWAMTGDLEGSWFIGGDWHLNTSSGKGGVAHGFVVVVVESPVVGAFECEGVATKLEFVPTPDFIQYGNVRGCHGSGDFDGMKMKAHVTNEDDPGVVDIVYDFFGEIW